MNMPAKTMPFLTALSEGQRRCRDRKQKESGGDWSAALEITASLSNCGRPISGADVEGTERSCDLPISWTMMRNMSDAIGR